MKKQTKKKIGVSLFIGVFTLLHSSSLVVNASSVNWQDYFSWDERIAVKHIAKSKIKSELKNDLREMIRGKNVKNGTITTKDIKNETVLAEDIATGAVRTEEILDQTIIGNDLASNINIVTTGNITAQDLTANGTLNANGGVINSNKALSVNSSSDIVLNPANSNGGAVIAGSNNDTLGTTTNRWSSIYANTVNFKDLLTDTNTSSIFSLGASGNTSITLGDSNSDDSLTIKANTSIDDGDWKINDQGEMWLNYLYSWVDRNLIIETNGNGKLGLFGRHGIFLDSAVDDILLKSVNTGIETTTGTGVVSITNGNLKVGNKTPSNPLNGEDAYIEGDVEIDGDVDISGDVVIGGGDTIRANDNDWSINQGGVGNFKGVLSTGDVSFSSADTFKVKTASSEPTTCTTGELYVNIADHHAYVCTNTNTWTQIDN